MFFPEGNFCNCCYGHFSWTFPASAQSKISGICQSENTAGKSSEKSRRTNSCVDDCKQKHSFLLLNYRHRHLLLLWRHRMSPTKEKRPRFSWNFSVQFRPVNLVSMSWLSMPHSVARESAASIEMKRLYTMQSHICTFGVKVQMNWDAGFTVWWKIWFPQCDLQ